MHKFDYLVYIGRFQPFHKAHLETIEIALQQSKYVILALGSAQHERTVKNPFLATERQQMILSNFSQEDQQRLIFVNVIDVYNDEKWQKLVKQLVQDVTPTDVKIGLIGHFKDDSSYYLKFFPEWDMLELDSLQNAISATPLREAYYRGEIMANYFPAGTIQFLQQFEQTEAYKLLQNKYQQQDVTPL